MRCKRSGSICSVLAVGLLLSTAAGCAADPNDAANDVEQKTSALNGMLSFDTVAPVCNDTAVGKILAGLAIVQPQVRVNTLPLTTCLADAFMSSAWTGFPEKIVADVGGKSADLFQVRLEHGRRCRWVCLGHRHGSGPDGRRRGHQSRLPPEWCPGCRRRGRDHPRGRARPPVRTPGPSKLGADLATTVPNQLAGCSSSLATAPVGTPHGRARSSISIETELGPVGARRYAGNRLQGRCGGREHAGRRRLGRESTHVRLPRPGAAWRRPSTSAGLHPDGRGRGHRRQPVLQSRRGRDRRDRHGLNARQLDGPDLCPDGDRHRGRQPDAADADAAGRQRWPRLEANLPGRMAVHGAVVRAGGSIDRIRLTCRQIATPIAFRDREMVSFGGLDGNQSPGRRSTIAPAPRCWSASVAPVAARSIAPNLSASRSGSRAAMSRTARSAPCFPRRESPFRAREASADLPATRIPAPSPGR